MLLGIQFWYKILQVMQKEKKKELAYKTVDKQLFT